MRYKGSFTIEAALIMPMILGVIVLFIYAAMYARDRCVIEYAAQSSSAVSVYSSDPEEEAAEHARQILSDKLILDWDTSVEISSDEDELITDIEAQIPLFGEFIHKGRIYKHFYPKY